MGFMDVIWASYEKKKQAFNFQLSDAAGNSSDVYCITKLQSQDLNFGSNPNNLFNVMTFLPRMTPCPTAPFRRGIYTNGC